jgi:uncharacterized membrane protein YdjX (TVP38/TMEM64 family)
VTAPDRPRPGRLLSRLVAPAILVALAGVVWWSGLLDHLSWSTVAREHASLAAWVAANRPLAACLFLVIYIVSVTLSLPHAGLLTVTGGVLFGTLIGGVLAIAGATIGAVLLFLIARSAFAASLARRGGTALAKLREELQSNGFFYLLSLRLVPLFPFWLINLAAALCGMRLGAFALATLIGIMPVTFVFASIGAGLGGVLSAGTPPGFGLVWSLPVLGPLLALSVLSLTPLIWRKWRARHA